MYKLRIYLDTSVFSAREDERHPDRREQTLEFWKRMAQFEPSTSELTRTELAATRDLDRQLALLKLLDEFNVIPITDDSRKLADEYVRAGAFSPRDAFDALHVACAVINRQDILLSWNFRHLVNRRNRAHVNRINVQLGLPTIEILAPPEV